MSTVWARRREELLSDCLVSPAVFHQIVDRLSEFVVPYQQTLETEAAHPMYLYLQGLLSHLQRKNAEDITIITLARRLCPGRSFRSRLWKNGRASSRRALALQRASNGARARWA